MALDPSIALGVRPLQLPDPLAQMAQVSQIQASQQQQQLNKMKIEELIADKQELNDFALKLQEKGLTPRQYMEMLRSSRDPVNRKTGVEGLMRLDEQDKYGEVLKKIYPKLYEGSAETPAAAPAPSIMRQGAAPAAPIQDTLGTGTYGMAPVNALAPAPAARPAAPVNALVNQQNTPERLEMNIAALAPFASRPGVKEQIAGFQAQLAELRKTAPDATLMKQLGYPLTQAGYQAFRDAQRQERMLNPEEEAQRIRIANASRAPVQPVAPTITTVEDPTAPGKFLQVDARVYRGGGANAPGVIGGARPSATTEKIAAQKTQMNKDLGFAITQLSDITKDGGLIDQSTGSGAGRLADIGAGFIGKATPGAIAIGKIAPVADLVLKMVPRFEGPQSNADTKSYKEAAGQLADPTLPTEIRKQAGKTVLRLMQDRKNQFVTSDMATEGVAANIPAPPAGFTPDQ